METLNGNLVFSLVAIVIVSAITGIAVCVKHVTNPDFFE